MRCRATTPADLGFVIGLERDPANAPFVTAWPHEEHLAALGDPDAAHLILERDDGRAVGYLILTDLHQRAIQLLRIVVADKGEGLGRAGVREAKRIAFEERGATRLWLDVKEHNRRARGLYESEGFVLEGPSPDEPGFLIYGLSAASGSAPTGR